MEQCYFKGDIFYIYPKNVTECEQTGGRPAIIVSNNVGNDHSPVVEVVYLTGQEKKPLPTHVKIDSANIPSVALCEQITTVSKKRIGQYINSVTQTELQEIDRAMLLSLDINSNIKGTKQLEAWGKMLDELTREDEANRVMKKAMEEDIIVPKVPNTPMVPVPVNIEMDPKYIQACTERDVYKELYMNLLKEMKRTA